MSCMSYCADFSPTFTPDLTPSLCQEWQFSTLLLPLPNRLSDLIHSCSGLRSELANFALKVPFVLGYLYLLLIMIMKTQGQSQLCSEKLSETESSSQSQQMLLFSGGFLLNWPLAGSGVAWYRLAKEQPCSRLACAMICFLYWSFSYLSWSHSSLSEWKSFLKRSSIDFSISLYLMFSVSRITSFLQPSMRSASSSRARKNSSSLNCKFSIARSSFWHSSAFSRTKSSHLLLRSFRACTFMLNCSSNLANFSARMSAFFLWLRQQLHSSTRLPSCSDFSEDLRESTRESAALAGEMKDCEEFVLNLRFLRKSSLSRLTSNAEVFSFPYPIVLRIEMSLMSLGLKSVWFLLGFRWRIPPVPRRRFFYDFGLKKIYRYLLADPSVFTGPSQPTSDPRSLCLQSAGSEGFRRGLISAGGRTRVRASRDSSKAVFFFSGTRLPTALAGLRANIFFLVVASVIEGELGTEPQLLQPFYGFSFVEQNMIIFMSPKAQIHQLTATPIFWL